MGEERGALTETVFYILLSLVTPLHGYGIMQHVKDLSNGRVILGAGTLYGAINTMLERQWIRQLEMDRDARKKEYVITNMGKAVLHAELSRLDELITNGKKILNNEMMEVKP